MKDRTAPAIRITVPVGVFLALVMALDTVAGELQRVHDLGLHIRDGRIDLRLRHAKATRAAVEPVELFRPLVKRGVAVRFCFGN